MIVVYCRVTSPISMPPSGTTVGHCRGAEPFHFRPTHCRMKLMPTAVIRAASFGARRSRRYATRSMTTLTTAPKPMAATSVSSIMAQLCGLGSTAPSQ